LEGTQNGRPIAGLSLDPARYFIKIGQKARLYPIFPMLPGPNEAFSTPANYLITNRRFPRKLHFSLKTGMVFADSGIDFHFDTERTIRS